jgi:thiamine biosynthesis lipoprotein
VRFRCFDTPNSVTVFGEAGGDTYVEDLLIAVRRSCLDFHRLWSFSLADSDIARVNAPAERIRVDVRTAELLTSMKAFHETEPTFDFTVGPVSYVWKHAGQVPSDADLRRALSHVGAEKVSIEGDVVVKADPLVQVDVGGAAKGFVADAIAADLRAAGVKSADIDLGGNLYMLGCHPDDRPWRVSVRMPEGVSAKAPILEVRDRSVVTSGSYERFVEIGGVRYQHIIDASTGYPIESDIVSATVSAKSSLQADMLATTALLAGTRGLDALKLRHPVEAFIVITDAGEVVR